MSSRPYRQNAVFAGVFFILATLFLFVGAAVCRPPLAAPDLLERAAGAGARIQAGIMIEFACVLAIPLVAEALYPVLRPVSPALAVGYAALRLFGAVIFAGMEVDRMLALALLHACLATPGADATILQATLNALRGGEAFSGLSRARSATAGS